MILNVTAYLIIPIYTFFFAWGTDLFTMNFSVLGSLASRKNAFLLWGILVGAYFYHVLRQIIRRLPCNEKETALTYTSLSLLILAVLTPYWPEHKPLDAFLHVVFAFSASVLLLLCLYVILWKLTNQKRLIYRPYLIRLHAITLASALLLFLAGIVSSALEIFFTVSCTVLVKRVYDRVTASRYS